MIQRARKSIGHAIFRSEILGAIVFLASPLSAGAPAASPLRSPVRVQMPSAEFSSQATLPDASQIVFTLSPAQSKLHFTLNATAHDVHGEFDFKRGEIRVDPSTARTSGEIVVDAASGRSGSDGRDSKMQKDVLESAKFPEISFRPDRIDGFSAGAATFHASVHGVFSIHGSVHEVTVPIDATISGTTWSATCTFKVPYVDWGLHDPSNFFLHVGHTVEVELTLAGSLSAPAAAH